ncbi:hypothetical protein [Leptodesmis sichuanensis]|uniref:hypothetical protein n=1 Tax=Leptodesmis sichuanensis TaxID=2906798 RepID=UPI001F3723F5|nr:hypothetical protein [Leptodesmis sichuanensis]UIE37917.1 hypothetical protein KIK02_23925 [Leptodesmis sichuanensis A121]
MPGGSFVGLSDLQWKWLDGMQPNLQSGRSHDKRGDRAYYVRTLNPTVRLLICNAPSKIGDRTANPSICPKNRLNRYHHKLSPLCGMTD